MEKLTIAEERIKSTGKRSGICTITIMRSIRRST